MEQRVHLDHVHCRAILLEVGERLRATLPVEGQSKLPAHIEDRLKRLRELDDDYSPSIVPSLEH
jgi:hypothetical protein